MSIIEELREVSNYEDVNITVDKWEWIIFIIGATLAVSIIYLCIFHGYQISIANHLDPVTWSSFIYDKPNGSPIIGFLENGSVGYVIR